MPFSPSEHAATALELLHESPAGAPVTGAALERVVRFSPSESGSQARGVLEGALAPRIRPAAEREFAVAPVRALR